MIPYDLSVNLLHIKSILSSQFWWCILEGSVWIWMKIKLYWLIKNQTLLAAHGMPRCVWPSMNRQRMFFVQTSMLLPSMHWKLNKHGRGCMQNDQLPVNSYVESEDNFITGLMFSWTIPATNFWFFVNGCCLDCYHPCQHNSFFCSLPFNALNKYWCFCATIWPFGSWNCPLREHMLQSRCGRKVMPH